MPDDPWLHRFVEESNRIEGIAGATDAQVDAHAAFLALERPTIEDMVALVGVLQPEAKLRDKESVPGVRVGNHIAPPSGPAIRADLQDILKYAVINPNAARYIHREYETLHPFTDGNGRSGRALWLWMMRRTNRAEQATALGFLHTWYYQSLGAGR